MGIIGTIVASLALSMVVSDIKPEGATAQAFDEADTAIEKAIVVGASPLILIVDGTESAITGVAAGGKAVGAGAVAAKDYVAETAPVAGAAIKDGSIAGYEATKAGAVKGYEATKAGAVKGVNFIGSNIDKGANKLADWLSNN